MVERTMRLVPLTVRQMTCVINQREELEGTTSLLLIAHVPYDEDRDPVPVIWAGHASSN